MDIDVFSRFPGITRPPAESEEIYEWVALLESVLAAGSTYTMIELGAGYGRWTAHAHHAVMEARPDLKPNFIAVEAEPTHFNWLREHLEKNGVDLDRCKLVNAPVAGKIEAVYFTVGHPNEWYGQAIIPSAHRGFIGADWPNAEIVTMESVTISGLIADLEFVDLIDMDIQGAELPAVEASIDALSNKARRLFISTHSDEIHDRIFKLLTNAGWANEAAYSLQREHDTNFGTIKFGDGVQYWVNRGFAFQARHRIRG